MDVDAGAINSGLGRCCHEIINDKEQKMNNVNANRGRVASPVNIMSINDVNVVAITDKLMSVVETTLFEELSKSEVHVDSYQYYGEEVVTSLMSQLKSFDISGVKYCSKSNKRPRTESREDAGSGGGDIIVTGYCDCDMSTATDLSNEDDITDNMAVDEESDKNHTAVNNDMLQEKDGDDVSKDGLDSSLTTTGKLCIIHIDV